MHFQPIILNTLIYKYLTSHLGQLSLPSLRGR